MYTHEGIQKNFGAPISHLIPPRLPYELKIWHAVLFLIILALVIYGGYSFYRNFIKKESIQERIKRIALETNQ